MGQRFPLFQTPSGPRYWGGVIAGVGLGLWAGYVIHQVGGLTVKAAYLALPCTGLSVLGQMVARSGGTKDASGPADERETR